MSSVEIVIYHAKTTLNFQFSRTTVYSERAPSVSLCTYLPVTLYYTWYVVFECHSLSVEFLAEFDIHVTKLPYFAAFVTINTIVL